MVARLARHPVTGKDEQAGTGAVAGLVRDGHRPVAIEPGEDVSREGMVGTRALQPAPDSGRIRRLGLEQAERDELLDLLD